MRKLYDKKEKTKGQVREETPVYTATYLVNRSDFLLEFLLKKCKTSRNNVKALLARRQVLVNGSAVSQFDFPLAKDDEVKIAKSPVRGETQKAKKPAVKRQGKALSAPKKINVIYEDERFLAIDKPEGLLSVESDKQTECAYGYALSYLAQQGKNARPFVLHRIDKETSGVLVFAKNIKIHSMIKMRWNELVSLREYYAVAEGVFAEKSGTLISYLKENKNNLTYVTNDPTGQKAVTHYEVVAENGEYSLLRVRIDTGRKNQIRVQMQAIQHPIVGDDKYGCNKNPLKRLGLHASKLEFLAPDTAEKLSFYAPPPPSFRALFGK